MDVSADLSLDAVRAALPGREVRFYPALLSTQADALAWARAGVKEGSVVVADYQASARGRAGLEWRVEPGTTLGLSIVLRPRLSAEREGWLYTVATTALADVVGDGASIEWPDQVLKDDRREAAAGVDVELGPQGCNWAVVNVLVSRAPQPRTPLLREVIEAIEARYHSPADAVLADYLPRCSTIGRRVRARMIPVGPSGPQVTGEAVGSLMDGALLLLTEKGSRVAVRPQNLGLLEDAPQSPDEASRG